jgi:hypothetical protein
LPLLITTFFTFCFTHFRCSWFCFHFTQRVSQWDALSRRWRQRKAFQSVFYLTCQRKGLNKRSLKKMYYCHV